MSFFCGKHKTTEESITEIEVLVRNYSPISKDDFNRIVRLTKKWEKQKKWLELLMSLVFIFSMFSLMGATLSIGVSLIDVKSETNASHINQLIIWSTMVVFGVIGAVLFCKALVKNLNVKIKNIYLAHGANYSFSDNKFSFNDGNAGESFNDIREKEIVFDEISVKGYSKLELVCSRNKVVKEKIKEILNGNERDRILRIDFMQMNISELYEIYDLDELYEPKDSQTYKLEKMNYKERLRK